ncbi:MAG: bifunctional diaminohydroxyphosphoribosylaminopyrimidine deaminase/5-amino-6-(5-phosphoribosylamino)uracil reductase RibD [Saprospiraceae bacterium]
MNKELYIQRCFDLSQQGAAGASPNPMVGAVLVHDNEIIGEGFHEKHGYSHAEVHALKSVPLTKHLQIPESTLYVSLEPCCIVGNTPACSDLIMSKKIKNVVYSVSDPTPGVDGTSKKILQKAGVNVESEVLTKEGNSVIDIRRTWVKKQRPYVILKFAQSADGFIGKQEEQVWLSNSLAKIVSHKWRSRANAILVGTNTAQTDDPALTNRLYSGTSPLRIVIDKQLKLTKDLQLFDQKEPTWVFTEKKDLKSIENLNYYSVDKEENYVTRICQELYDAKKGVLLVEGGAKLLQSFIDQGYWDEIRIFKTPVVLGDGIEAPTFSGKPGQHLKIRENRIEQWLNKD